MSQIAEPADKEGESQAAGPGAGGHCDRPATEPTADPIISDPERTVVPLLLRRGRTYFVQSLHSAGFWLDTRFSVGARGPAARRERDLMVKPN